MTKFSKPFSLTTFELFDDWHDPIRFENEFDKRMLQKRIHDVVDADKLKPGWDHDLIEIGLRVAAQRARYLHKYRFTSAQNALKHLKALAEACEQIGESGERCHANGIIDEFSIAHARGQVSLHDELLPMSREDYSELANPDSEVYNPYVIEDFPMESVIDAAKIVSKAARKQLLDAKDALKEFSFASRADSEIIAKAVYDVHRNYGKDSVNCPGSNTAELALLYSELCRLAGVSEGDPESALRKFTRTADSGKT